MMIVDSATPMFTSDFTILQGPNMGGVDLALGVPSMINEWNPLDSSVPALHIQHSSHSHDGYFGEAPYQM